MPQAFRVLLHRHFKTGEVDPALNIAIDLPLNDKSLATNMMTQFGAIGGLSAKSLHVTPFSLYTTGEIDFGTGYDTKRWGSTDLLAGRPIQVGEYFSFTLSSEGDEEMTYQVTAVLPLK